MELEMILSITEMTSECFPRVDKQVRTSCQASLSWCHGPYGIAEVGNICMRNRYCSLTLQPIELKGVQRTLQDFRYQQP